MATYFTDDFADFSTDWTRRFNTASTDYSVSSGDLIYCNGKLNDWCVVSWDDIDGDANRDDIDVLGILRSTNLDIGISFFTVRGSGTDENASHYIARIYYTSISIYYCSGSDTATLIQSSSGSYSVDTDYWFRFRVNGTTLQFSVWTGAVGDEPGTPDINTTDSTVSGVGWAGPSLFSVNQNTITLKQVGIGTNGDAGPSSAGGGGGVAPTGTIYGPLYGPMAGPV